jgi:predicted HicB family RNase H-like nuclease
VHCDASHAQGVVDNPRLEHLHGMKRKLRDQLVVRVDRKLRRAIEAAAERDKRTVSDFLRIMLADRVPVSEEVRAA